MIWSAKEYKKKREYNIKKIDEIRLFCKKCTMFYKTLLYTYIHI